jgi:hypothetical protein
MPHHNPALAAEDFFCSPRIAKQIGTKEKEIE